MSLLLPLVTRLRACPAAEASLSSAAFKECWEGLRQENISHLDQPGAAMMAAMLVESRRFAALLNPDEHAQLLRLIDHAVERYEQQTNPPNQLGKLLASSLKPT
jgi:hypothetical protein